MAVEIECVTEVSDELAEAFARLMPQLSPCLGGLSREALERVVCSDCTALFAASSARKTHTLHAIEAKCAVTISRL